MQTLREPDWVIGGLDGAAAQLEVKRTTLLMRAVNRNLPGYCRVLEKRPPVPGFHLAIEGRDAKAYWMHVAVPVTDTELHW